MDQGMKSPKKQIVAIDAKELAKEHIGSLGMILLELLPRLSKRFEVLLFSDVSIPSQFLQENPRVVIRDRPYCGGTDLVKYQYWLKKKCSEYCVDWFFQINHFSLFKMGNTKQIVVIHDLYPLEEIEHKSVLSRITYWISLFLTLIHADKIFTVSEFTKSRLEHFFWESQKIEVNYNGIAPFITDQQRIVDEKFFLMLGRVSYWKGTIRVAEFFEKYFANSEFKLIIAGQAQSSEDSRAMNEIAGRVSNIIWLDYVDDKTKDWLLQNASLFLYASRYDGFGKPPLEAALAKTPTLINDIPVLREVTKNNGNYVDFYGQDEELYQAVCNVISKDNSEQVDQMQKVAQSYTWDNFASKIIATVESA